MRFSPPALVALAGSIAFASANSLKQYKPRSLIDVCAIVSANLNILGEIFGAIEICACISSVESIVSTDPVCKKAALKYGHASVTSTLTNLIYSSGSQHSCSYPDHSTPICNLLNPCDFTCNNGYFPHPIIRPTSCVCNYPFTVCNGVCGIFYSCPSPKPVYKRDANWRDSTCPHGWSACGVSSGSRLDYECVDASKDLWSCGGCGIPLLPDDPIGEDCTAIAGVLDVSCEASSCVVARCKDGYRVSDNRTTCESTTRTSPNVPILIQNGEASFQARGK